MPNEQISIDQSGKVVKNASGNQDRDSSTAKQNYTAQTWSNDHGSITLGQVDYVGSVTSAFFCRG